MHASTEHIARKFSQIRSEMDGFSLIEDVN